MRGVIWWLILAAAVGCETEATGPAPAWLDDVEAPAPLWLSETGLYASMAERSPARGVHAYTPPRPLWSDGAAKERLLFLPPETFIDAAPAAWRFPIGTVIAKSFGFRKIEGRGDSVAIETRILFQRRDGWRYVLYHWNQQGTEARRVGDADGSRWAEVPLRLEDEVGNAFEYTLPGELDCEACHDTQPDVPVIGISPLNFDPALVDQGLIRPPPAPAAFPARSPAEAKAMDWLVGNCVHCHHGKPRGDNASFSLLPIDLVASTVGVPTASSASGDGIRVVPGDAAGSALYEAVVRARLPDYPGDFKPMP
ncbi:MAG: hypothetical protein KC620_14055, partial [Myxococcales bacterium]|nr:hypothetical protein [Myxococcales bacterium]